VKIQSKTSSKRCAVSVKSLFLALACCLIARAAFPQTTTGPASAGFVASDTTTQGNWQGVYGSDGYSLANNSLSIPPYATLAVQPQNGWTWAGASTTADPRALELGTGAARFAATWYNQRNFYLDINVKDGNLHQVAVYLVDWDSQGRSETVQVVDATTGTQLDIRSISGFTNGIYLIWNVSGHVHINVTTNSGPNSVVSGVFFATTNGVNVKPVTINLSASKTQQFTASVVNSTNQNVTWSINPAFGSISAAGLYAAPATIAAAQTVTVTATSAADMTKSSSSTIGLVAGSAVANFVSLDTATKGNWTSLYGVDGYSLASANQALPAYDPALAVQNQLGWIWASSTSDPRALKVPGGTGSIASTWYSAASFGLDVNLTDGKSHQVALYAVDWDNMNRAETIQIQDATTNAVLDTQTLTKFTNGVYAVWNIAGHVKVIVTNTSYPNSVVSGVFFGNGGPTVAAGTGTGSGTPPANPTPTPTPAPPTTGTGSSGSSGSGSSTAQACPPAINAVAFLGIDTTTQGAWKEIGNFNAPPASASLVYGKDGVILPDTEGCDKSCNPFPLYASFGPQCVNSATAGNIGAKAYSTHAYVALVQGSSGVMGAEPQNATNTAYFQCNYTFSNAAAPWAPVVAWRPVVDTREISNWYTCSGITSYYLEFSFGNSTHNFEVYVVDDQNGGTQLRSEELQVLDGDTNAVLYDSGSFTNFTGGLYYKWSVSGHVKVKLINTSANGTNAVINGAFFN